MSGNASNAANAGPESSSVHSSTNTAGSSSSTDDTQPSVAGRPGQVTISSSPASSDLQSSTKAKQSGDTSPLKSVSTATAAAGQVLAGTGTSSVVSPTSAAVTNMATQASSSADPSTPTPSGNNTGITAGALAGGIIGAFAAGLLLALMAAFLLNMRHKKRTVSRDPRGSTSTQRKGTVYEKVSESGGITSSWERYLPQSIDDQSMKSSVQSLLNQVNLHVDNFYTRSEVAIDSTVAEGLARMDTGLFPETLPMAMAQPNMQIVAIKHSIAFTITTRMLPSNDPDSTLLPPHLAALPEKLLSDSGSGKEIPATRQAYCQWKALTSYLYPDVKPSATTLAQQRKASMAIVKTVTAAFSQWEVQAIEGPSAAEHLAQIIDVARDVGTTVMSQASSFDLRWRLSPRQQGDHLVVFPGFVKVADEKGRPLERVQTLIRPLAQDLSGGN